MRAARLLCCVVAIIAGRATLGTAAPPNFVIIFVDDLGYGDIGPFGNTKIRTPHLDRLAADGMKFHSFYATPVCSMSRAALLTGCYSARVSMPGVLFPKHNVGLNPAETTVAEVLRGEGYSTTCIGKWHLGHRQAFLPTQQGFDSYFGIPYSNDMTLDPAHARFAADCRILTKAPADEARRETVRNSVPLMRGDEVVEYPADQQTLTKRYTEEAVRFLRAHQAEPFFLYLPHTMIHDPMAASDAFRGQSADGLIGDAIEEIDWSVGQIVQALHDLQLDEKTLLIFTSDNGPAHGSAGPFRGKKGDNRYEGGVREPCIMRWTGKIPAGTECQQIAGNIDILPTLGSLAGAAASGNHSVAGRTIDGRDIAPLMFDPQAPPVRETHMYYGGDQLLHAYRRGPWKIVLAGPYPARETKGNSARPKKERKVELYDLSHDPGESQDLAAEQPELVAELVAEAQRRADEVASERRPIGTLAGEAAE